VQIRFNQPIHTINGIDRRAWRSSEVSLSLNNPCSHCCILFRICASEFAKGTVEAQAKTDLAAISELEIQSGTEVHGTKLAARE
jgi:hypothetical protein